MRLSCSAERIKIINCIASGATHDRGAEVLKGLMAAQKYLPSKYFYDNRGSALFEQICRLPEYYQTRTELRILRSIAPLVMEKMRQGVIIDLGSGANWKVKVLLDAADGTLARIRYMPVDVCESVLKQESLELVSHYPGLTVTGMVADLMGDLESIAVDAEKLILFFGGTIGNLKEEESRCFLKKVARLLRRHDRLLVGMDLIKDKNILEAAYNDRKGVTAAFNRNILNVMNREFDASFDAAGFDHLAFYNGEQRQVEMHLRANRDMHVSLDRLRHEVTMKAGETIHTEICRKFDRNAVEEMAARAGLNISRWFTDDREWFALVEMVASPR